MELLHQYFGGNLRTSKILTELLSVSLVPAFKALNVKDNKSLQNCRLALIDCVHKIPELPIHIMIVEQQSFIKDLHFCIQATKVLEDYNKTLVDYRNIMRITLEDIFKDNEPADISMMQEVSHIMILLSWKKALR